MRHGIFFTVHVRERKEKESRDDQEQQFIVILQDTGR